MAIYIFHVLWNCPRLGISKTNELIICPLKLLKSKGKGGIAWIVNEHRLHNYMAGMGEERVIYSRCLIASKPWVPFQKTDETKQTDKKNPKWQTWPGWGPASSAGINPSWAGSQEMHRVVGPTHFLWAQCGWTPACPLIPSKKMVSMISLVADQFVLSPLNTGGIIFRVKWSIHGTEHRSFIPSTLWTWTGGVTWRTSL